MRRDEAVTDDIADTSNYLPSFPLLPSSAILPSMERRQIAPVCLIGAAQGTISTQARGSSIPRGAIGRQQRVCVNCEYFDGGGQRKVEQARKTGNTLGGDCLNPGSSRFETKSDQTCPVFFPDSSRG